MTYTCNDCGNECDIIQVPTNDRDIQPDNESECCGAEFEEIVCAKVAYTLPSMPLCESLKSS